MQLSYAAENLIVIPPEHFLAKKANDLTGIKELVKKDPAALMRNILESLGRLRHGHPDQPAHARRYFHRAGMETLVGLDEEAPEQGRAIFSSRPRRASRSNLRGEKVSRADELITFFNQARQPKEQAAALDQIIKFHHEFDKPETQLQPIVATIEEAAARNQRLESGAGFRAGHGARRSCSSAVPTLKTTNPDLTLTRLIADEEARLITILPKLPAGEGTPRFAGAACGARAGLDGARLAIDAEQSRPRGLADSARFRGGRDAGRAARVFAARNSRALGHERNAGLALQGTRRRMARH